MNQMTSMIHFPWRRSFLGAMPLLLLTGPICSLCPVWAQVDLEARSIQGPGMAHVGRPVLVRVEIASLGAPPFGEATARIVISQDELLDAGDPVVATFQDSTFGPRGVVAEIPPQQAEGLVYFGLLVTPMPGEIVTSNNRRLGNPCSIVRTDLCLDDPAPLELFVRPTDPEPQSLDVTVQNAGSPGSLLVFTVEALAPAPFLTIWPPTGFAVGGSPGSSILLSFDHSGLAPGSYLTTLRFENFLDPADFEDLPVRLTVGEPWFHPGDRLIGRIEESGATDQVGFDALDGMVLRISARTTRGNLQPTIEILDPSGEREAVLRFRNSSRSIQRAVRLRHSGSYQLRIKGGGGSTGSYRLLTGRKLPGKAQNRSVKARPGPDGSSAATPILLLPGSVLDFRVRPNARFSGPLGLLFETPAGSFYDIAGFTAPDPEGGLVISGLPITLGGRYVIRTSGFGTRAGEAVRLKIRPHQPPPGGDKLYLR